MLQILRLSKKEDHIPPGKQYQLEANIEKLFDYVVLITADEEIKKQRTVESKKFSSEEFDKRIQNQIKDDEKGKRADFVFFNNTTRNDLRIKANLLLLTLNSLLK